MDGNMTTSAQQLKTCKLCSIKKPLDEFHKCKHTRDGRNTYCKPCANRKARENHQKNKEERLARCKEYYQANKEKLDAANRRWALDNPEKRREHNKNYYYRDLDKSREKSRNQYYKNPAKYKAWQVDNIDKVREMKAAWRQKRGAEYSRELRSKIRKATPEWADMGKMNEVYLKALEMSQGETKYQVGHIVPIQGKTVCGLHCEDNLQVLTARDNRLKSNKLKI